MSKDKFRDDLAGEVFLPRIDPNDNRYLFDYKKMPIEIYFKGHLKPLEIIKQVFKTLPSSVPDYIKFLGMDSAIILGYGKEGKITEKYLRSNFPNLKIGIGDVETDADYLEKQVNYDIAIRSPGLAKENVKIPYTTATNIFFSYVRQIPGVKIIGVTGTKGKSTTASLIYHILKKAGKNAELLGNIGTPMLSAILEDVKKDTIFVLELSSYQLDDIKYSPDIAVVTSLFPEHMDYHYGIKNYYAAKKNIIKYQEPEDILIFNPKNRKMDSWIRQSAAKNVPFAPENFLDGVNATLEGKHNQENIRAAVAVAKSFDIQDDIIKNAIESFKPLPHRLELVGEFKGIKFYDDAISTTPESTIMAIKTLPKIGTIFLGGENRGYKFSELAKTVRKFGIKNFVLFPETGKKIIKTKRGLNILETESMEEAVKFAYANTPKGEICLLSCASPSYSLWKNFEEKGDQFKSWVKYFNEK
jgi:UDP-N-acetylmuramoylalanine--D-glutamate ligase